MKLVDNDSDEWDSLSVSDAHVTAFSSSSSTDRIRSALQQCRPSFATGMQLLGEKRQRFMTIRCRPGTMCSA